MTARVIVALDAPSWVAAAPLVDRLAGRCDFYKVGLELFAAEGPAVVERLRARGCEVFVDLKAHDIPNTVRGLARSVAGLGARLVTVHAIGGAAMLAAAVEGAGAQDGTGCGVLAVTVLTSFDDAAYAAAVGRPVRVADEVLRLADLARAAGCHGVVCSGHEVAAVVARSGGGLAPLVPGVRLAGGAVHDQTRVVTPAEAVAAGARYLVVGRAVSEAEDPGAAWDELRAEAEKLSG